MCVCVCVQNRNVWLLFFAFGLSGGLFEAFFILLNQIMEPDGFSLVTPLSPLSCEEFPLS